MILQGHDVHGGQTPQEWSRLVCFEAAEHPVRGTGEFGFGSQRHGEAYMGQRGEGEGARAGRPVSCDAEMTRSSILLVQSDPVAVVWINNGGRWSELGR